MREVFAEIMYNKYNSNFVCKHREFAAFNMFILKGDLTMGLIKAGIGALGGTLADQWKEFFYCDALDKNVMMKKGEKRVSGRSSNTKASDNIISNGSGIADNADTVIIGALMILVPGFLFTNSLRDIIYGDTMSGVNRLVQVLIIAVALVVGTSAAVSFATVLFGGIESGAYLVTYSLPIQCIAGMIGTLGFCLWFNIHGHGLLLCLLGSIISWLVYSLCAHFNMNLYGCYFIAAAVVSLYAEIMARIRKYPATSYLLASLVPLIPGAGVYYTMSAIARSDMATFSQKGVETAAIAGSIAIGILLVSSSFRMLSVYKQRRACKKAAK